MIRSAILILFVITFSSFSIPSGSSDALKPIEEQSFNFKIDKKKLLAGSYQYYIDFIKKGEKLNADEKKNLNQYLGYDIYNIHDSNVNEQYHVIMSKTAYVVDASIDFFSSDRVRDLSFIRKTLPDYDVNLNDDGSYRIKCGGMAPDFEYDLKTYYPSYKDSKLNYFLKNITNNDVPGVSPKMITLQHNYNFGTVLWQKTNKMSIVFCAYYPVGENKTLIINHTLNLVHNVPPNFIGGADMMLDMIVDGISEYIVATNSAVKENYN
ncbi:hypothetical protein [Marinigracilibium pacificum]|uniref:Uncharacterized protein n=1 Tax=Marinigracilibium pacificum TaxID=2729599 RepID=A0A848IXV2_9BACT|nr:hypothetical protein [Marinigracilibium pacificum]NMM48115.1 hypothetical protein [Marinigracilibium pacificum]